MWAIGERLDAFWTVFTMDRAWAVVLHSPTIISDDDHVGAQVDSPWPLDMESYENVSTSCQLPHVNNSMVC